MGPAACTMGSAASAWARPHAQGSRPQAPGLAPHAQGSRTQAPGLAPLPLLLLRHVIVDCVVVRLIRDKYVLLDRDVGRGIESTGRDADVIAADLFPKQVAAANAAESSLGGVRGFVPAQGPRSRHFDICRRRTRHGCIVTAGSTALRAMAGDNPAQRPENPITNPSAQASAGVRRLIFGVRRVIFRHVLCSNPGTALPSIL